MSFPHYVVGFLFDDQKKHLALIIKNRPNWQKGKLNGVGGIVEKDESPEQAMIRESVEEFGVTPPAWISFATLHNPYEQQSKIVAIHYFYAISTQTLRGIQQKTDEEPIVILVRELDEAYTIPNVKWLVPMALSMDQDSAAAFSIDEHPETEPTPKSPFDNHAEWHQEPAGHYRLTHINLELATITTQPTEPIALVGQFLWTTHVCHDARIHTSLPIQGRAFTLAEAIHIVETLLLATHTLEWPQLPFGTSATQLAD